MIFSLGEKQISGTIPEISEVDIFCFFSVPQSVQIPTELLWKSILSSLKLKKTVIILEENLAQIPTLGASRWLVGEKFLMLAPRSSSVLLEAIQLNSASYQDMKAHLISFK